MPTCGDAGNGHAAGTAMSRTELVVLVGLVALHPVDRLPKRIDHERAQRKRFPCATPREPPSTPWGVAPCPGTMDSRGCRTKGDPAAHDALAAGKSREDEHGGDHEQDGADSTV